MWATARYAQTILVCRGGEMMAIIQEKGHWNLHEILGRQRWATEVPDMRSYPDEQRCPVCSHPVVFGYHSHQLVPIKDREGDLMHWSGKCCCGAELIIFND